MDKVDRTVVRNQPYQRKGINIRERHNERKNETYQNSDIVPERRDWNIHFKRCPCTYEQMLDTMLQEKTVSDRGLKPDAKVFAELVFDVNTGYFESHGGYEYAKQFFEEVYHFAEKEVGAPYILSAVMHADECNRGLSAGLGRDVYHYHLHVVYIPIVEKEIKWSKRCKDQNLVGTTKEIIHQISHSKKWAYVVQTDEAGNPILDKNGKLMRIPSYSLLQDRFFQHMQQAGYTDLERGVRGSTAENLLSLEYKVQQEEKRLHTLTEKTSEQEANLQSLNKELVTVKMAKATVQEIDSIGKKKRLSNKVELTTEELQKLQGLAKEGILSRTTISELYDRISKLQGRVWELEEQFDRVYEATREFRQVMKLAPQRVKETFSEILQQAKEAKQQKKLQRKSGQTSR